jgi:integrase
MATTGKGTRRANGEGSISYDAARKRYDVRVVVDGKRRKVSAPTQAEAWRRANALRTVATVPGLPVRPTVADWLEHWKTHVLPGTVKRTTEDSYVWLVDRYIAPMLGRYKLAELKPAHVRQMLKRMENGVDGQPPLSANTRRLTLAVLRIALRTAERDGLVTRNVAALTEGVRLETIRGRSLTPTQAQQFVAEIAASDPLTEALLTLLIATGMRKGEALGLRWSDVDVAAETVHVRRTLSRVVDRQRGRSKLVLAESTKTDGSNRVVELDPLALGALRRWRVVQTEQRLACPPMPDGLSWGFGFPDDLVFTGNRGQVLDLSRPNEMLNRITTKLDLGHWHPHELRHSAASLMLGAGVALPTVSRVLGHASIATTYNVYGHLVSGEKRAAAAALAGILINGRTSVAGT